MFKIIDLEGTAFERGQAQGEALREDWRHMEREFFTSEILEEALPFRIPEFIIRAGLGFVGTSRTRVAVKKYLPGQHERVRGIAKGLGIPEAYEWGIHFLELMFCLAPSSLKIPPNTGCTQIHATGKATADGRPLSGRNYDFPNMLLDYQIIRRDTPSEKGRLATISVTQVPLAGAHNGMNERGLLVCANNNRAWSPEHFNRRGVHYMLLAQEALETCSTTKQALDYLTSFPARANAGFLGIMDEKGDCAVIEFTASKLAVARPGSTGTLTRTNHFITIPEANLPKGTTWRIKGMPEVEYAQSTEARHDAADRLMREAAGKITIETMMSILRDHSFNNGEGNMDTVCCHGPLGSTLASIITDLQARYMLVAHGTPCTSEYQKVEFKPPKK